MSSPACVCPIKYSSIRRLEPYVIKKIRHGIRFGTRDSFGWKNRLTRARRFLFFLSRSLLSLAVRTSRTHSLISFSNSNIDFSTTLRVLSTWTFRRRRVIYIYIHYTTFTNVSHPRATVWYVISSYIYVCFCIVRDGQLIVCDNGGKEITVEIIYNDLGYGGLLYNWKSSHDSNGSYAYLFSLL